MPHITLSEQIWNFIVHLRIKFVLILVPLFFFGLLISNGFQSSSFSFLDPSFVTLFFVLHICMYGGANSLNSYYDKDDGPIGGLENPPQVDESTFYLSWFVQLLGFFISLVYLPISFSIWYFFGMLMSVMYSHPSFRLKGSPFGSVIIVSIMQGLGAYSAGWIAGGVPMIEIFHLRGILGALSIEFMTLGLYPLTQVYQIEEDKKHKDLTIAIYLGLTGTFHWAIFFIGLCNICLALLFTAYFSIFQAVLCSIYVTGLMYSIDLWRRNFNPTKVKHNFGILHAINYVNSSLFSLFVLGHFSGILTKL